MSATAFMQEHTLNFLHVFLRVSGIFVLTPIFSQAETPLKVRGGISMGLALVIYPLVLPYLPGGSELSPGYCLLLAADLLIGLSIGLIIFTYYSAFLLSGELYSIQLGLGIVNVLDPLSESPIPILGQIKSLLALIVFILVGGHHLVIEALVYSFRAVPALTLAAAGPLSGTLGMAFREMFMIAFQLAAPVMGTVFLIEIVMGILSKVAPQMNIMVVGFQIKIIVGLVLLAAIMPAVCTMSDRVFGRSFSVIRALMDKLA